MIKTVKTESFLFTLFSHANKVIDTINRVYYRAKKSNRMRKILYIDV